MVYSQIMMYLKEYGPAISKSLLNTAKIFSNDS